MFGAYEPVSTLIRVGVFNFSKIVYVLIPLPSLNVISPSVKSSGTTNPDSIVNKLLDVYSVVFDDESKYINQSPPASTLLLKAYPLSNAIIFSLTNVPVPVALPLKILPTGVPAVVKPLADTVNPVASINC